MDRALGPESGEELAEGCVMRAAEERKLEKEGGLEPAGKGTPS